jgi:hypothetical protein
VTRTCVDCRQPFSARGAWQERCWACWRADRDAKARDTGYAEGYRAGLAAAAPALDGALLADLVALAHPDRHPPERAALAHRATVALLALRSETRQAA